MRALHLFPYGVDKLEEEVLEKLKLERDEPQALPEALP